MFVRKGGSLKTAIFAAIFSWLSYFEKNCQQREQIGQVAAIWKHPHVLVITFATYTFSKILFPENLRYLGMKQTLDRRQCLCSAVLKIPYTAYFPMYLTEAKYDNRVEII